MDLRYADLRGAFLPGTVLTDAHLEGADLLLADLRQTELGGAYLEGADLLGAHLNNADLAGADLRNADLTEADLTDADISYADFTGATGLTAAQLAKARRWTDAFYDTGILQATRLPPDHNDHVREQRKSENDSTHRNPAAAAAARVAQLSRLVPGTNTEATIFIARLVRHPEGSTELEVVSGAAPASNERAGPFTVAELAMLHNFPTDLDGRGQTIGIVEFSGGYREVDLNSYFTSAKLPTPSISSVSVNGQKNSPSGSPASADAQVEMDIEVAGAVAPKAALVAYFSSFTAKGFLDAVNAAVHDSAHGLSVLLIDWGSPEGQSAWSMADMQAINQAFRNAAESGITVVVASGDDGARDNVKDGRTHVDFPASSPFVLAVGGTRLNAKATSIESETVWNDNAGGATGGGVSDVFPRPDWQSAVNVPLQANGHPGRALPDVAADASPLTGYKLFVDGQTSVFGGTSASAPLWAGLIALLNQGLGRHLGYLNPLLYQKIGPSGVLHAITSGDNTVGNVKGYSAGPGWNACTGWGTPDGKKLLEALR